MNRPQGRGATALEKHYAFLLWLFPVVEQFPRGQKFILGDRLQVAALSVLESLTEATYSQRVAGSLDGARPRCPPIPLCRIRGRNPGSCGIPRSIPDSARVEGVA